MSGDTEPAVRWEHKAGDRYMPVACSAWMNESGSGTTHTVLEQPGTWDRARARGFDAVGSDDFQIAVVRRSGVLVALLWMDEIVDDDPEVLAEIAAEMNLKGPA